MSPFEEGGAYFFVHGCPSVRLSVCLSVCLNLMQLITQEGFAPEASNLVGREFMISRWSLLRSVGESSRSKVILVSHTLFNF